MKGLLVAMGCGGLLACASSGQAPCDPDPYGWYDVELGSYHAICELEDGMPADLPLTVLVTEPGAGSPSVNDFSSDGCELHLGGHECLGGFCGELGWSGEGVYEGDLTYVRYDPPGPEGGGVPACLVHSEEATLTLRERHPREAP